MSRRGRPPEADAGEIAQVALRLFERKGFEQVTMDEVAAAASVSRRTLFRVYPSKLDLVWAGADGVIEAVALGAAQLPQMTLQAFVEELALPALSQVEATEVALAARRRLRLMATAPALLNHRALREVEEIIARVVKDPALQGVPGSLAARTFVATLFGAVLWWAEHGEGMRLVDVARGALKTMALAVAKGPRGRDTGASWPPERRSDPRRRRRRQRRRARRQK
jgi:AcrR family transcriptional regulator